MIKTHCDFCDEVIPKPYSYKAGYFGLVRYRLFPFNFDKKDTCIICQDCLTKILKAKDGLAHDTPNTKREEE